MGATIATCHTNEYARGIEGREYLEGIKEGKRLIERYVLPNL